MKRLEAVDAIRGIAILLVVAFHYVNHAVSPAFLGAHPLVGKLLQQVTALAWAGVDLFFVISGFLIAAIFIKNQRAENFVQVYFARRALRILPMYVVTLLAFLVLARLTGLPERPGGEWLFDGFFGLHWYVLFIQNIAIAMAGSGGPNWLGITWSLAVEEQFYVLAAILFLGCGRRTVICLCVLAILVVAPVARLWADQWGGWHAHYALLPGRLDLFCSGILIAYAINDERVRLALTTALHRWHWLVLGALLALLPLVRIVGWLSPDAMVGIGYSLVMVLSAGLLLAGLVGLPWMAPIAGSSVLRWVGLRCYSIYLLHMPVQGLIYLLVLERAPGVLDATGWLLQLLVLAATLAISALTWVTIEQPCIRLGASLRYRFAVATPEVGRRALASSGG